MNDATVAEDLAIRFADATRGRLSGHFTGWEEYEETRDRCMATLFAAAASTHGVDVQQVRDLLAQRPLELDLLVVLSFAILYSLVSDVIVEGILSRFPVDQPTPAAIAFLIIAPVLSACAGLAFGLWAGTIEMVRLGNMHMSYRVDRLPLNQHPFVLFVSGVVLFWATVAFRYYGDHRVAHRTAVQSS